MKKGNPNIHAKQQANDVTTRFRLFVLPVSLPVCENTSILLNDQLLAFHILGPSTIDTPGGEGRLLFGPSASILLE